MIDIREYIGLSKELTAEQVRKLPAGTRITIHSFSRRGEHQMLSATVQQSYKHKVISYEGIDGLSEHKPIRKETERMCYTEGWT